MILMIIFRNLVISGDIKNQKCGLIFVNANFILSKMGFADLSQATALSRRVFIPIENTFITNEIHDIGKD